MKTFAVFDAKNRFSELLALVEAGQEVAITRRGTPIARLVSLNPADTAKQSAAVAEVFASLRKLRERVELDGDVKALARQGLD